MKDFEKEIKKINSELKDLEKFRDTTFLKKFKRQLQGELSTIKEQLRKRKETKQDKVKRRLEKNKIANKNRSAKNKRVWKYVKSIQKNYYPDKSIKEIRSQLKKHKAGLENDVSDVAWRNPSP